MLANLFGTSNAVSSSTGNGRTPPNNKQRSDHHHHSQPTNGTQYARGGTAVRSVTAPMRGSSQSTEIFNQPPRKVIRATRDYKAQFVNELEFVKGEFFFVITDLDDFYYEAMNPIARVRGLVPRSHFESLDKIAAGTQHKQQPPATPTAAAKAPAPESPLEYLQNQLNLRQQQQQREPPSRDRDRDHQRAYDSIGARRSERDAASYYRSNDNSSSSHMSVSAMTASTTTNYDDYKHHSSYTHGYAESDASSDTHSSAYSTVHSTDYPVSRSPVPVRPSRENRQQQQQPRQEQQQPERPPPRAIPMSAGRRKQSLAEEEEDEEDDKVDRRHRHPEQRGQHPVRQRHHTDNGQNYQHQQQQQSTRSANVTKPAYPSTPRVAPPREAAPPSASLLSKSAPSSQQPSHQLHRYPTTTSTTTAAKPISGMGGRLPHPVSAHVQTDTMLPDGRFQYTIELHLSDDTSRVLLRVFDDFYTLHVSLLSQFAAQSGRLRDQPRSIPFLPPAPVTPKPFNSAAQAAAPPAQVTPAEQARRRRALDAYLTDLVALPAPIRHSPPLNRFFMQRKGDNTLATAVRFDTSAALMDLISDYNSYPSMSRNGGKTSTTATKSLTALPTPSTSLDLLDDHFVRIKLHLPSGDETLAWRIDEAMPFMDFVDEVAAKTRWRMRDGWAMWYKDEVGGLVKLTGESDWRLVVRGRWEKVVLYID
ncbi:bud emergence protein 1 [Geranomyces variabilis]|nr:bud emergence protein 1 [Geranomyces variabilis]